MRLYQADAILRYLLPNIQASPQWKNKQAEIYLFDYAPFNSLLFFNAQYQPWRH